MKTTGKEQLLVNIIEPNAEVRPEFVSYAVETKDDESLLGLVANETATSVTLRQACGTVTVLPPASMTAIKSQGQSITPEGLEVGLTPQQMAVLLEFISQQRKETPITASDSNSLGTMMALSYSLA